MIIHAARRAGCCSSIRAKARQRAASVVEVDPFFQRQRAEGGDLGCIQRNLVIQVGGQGDPFAHHLDARATGDEAAQIEIQTLAGFDEDDGAASDMHVRNPRNEIC